MGQLPLVAAGGRQRGTNSITSRRGVKVSVTPEGLATKLPKETLLPRGCRECRVDLTQRRRVPSLPPSRLHLVTIGQSSFSEGKRPKRLAGVGGRRLCGFWRVLGWKNTGGDSRGPGSRFPSAHTHTGRLLGVTH